jgi:muramoyltetrapeptide carboxypeptidase
MANLVPHRVERAQEALQDRGFKVLVSPHALERVDYVSADARTRAHDLMEMFLDPSVKAIISMIGGNHSNQILKYLDFEAIKAHPKIFFGYSDITVLHMALQSQAGLVTFYGPAALTQFAENPEPLPYTLEYFTKAVCTAQPIGRIISSHEWTCEMLNWLEKKDLKRPRKMQPNPGWRWLRSGRAQGPISGGCIASLMHVRGTKYCPDWKGKILFWEISESEADFSKGDPPSLIDSYLADLDNSGIFSQISGMVIGRTFGYEASELQNLFDVVAARTQGYSFPILYGVDIGHTDPMMTIPGGIQATLDAVSDIFSIDEAATI